MTNIEKIKSKPYRNWLRGALGLFYLQKGLYPFTDRVVKGEHARIVQNLSPCTSCTIENILPAHASSKVCIQTNKGKCNCKKKANRSCATCGKIYDDIVLLHRFRDPHWVIDCPAWYKDHWQFAKCFLTTTTKGSNNTAVETDASGLLSIIINGEFFQQHLLCNIDPPNDTFSQVRETRNEILHNSTLDLKDQDVTKYLQSMITILEDKTALCSDTAAQAAAIKLKELLSADLYITTDEEAKAIQTALDAIKEAKEQSEESIRKLAQKQTQESTSEIDNAKERAKTELTSTVSKVFEETYEPEIKKIKLGHEDHENRLRKIEAQTHGLGEQVAKLKNTEETHLKRIEYLKQKQDLQQHLLDEYQKEDVKTSISPLMTQQNNVNISDVYASPRMVEEEKGNDKDGNTTEAGKYRVTNNKHLEIGDLFGTVEKRNRKIFIVGDVGTGKSSLCKMMMQHWCSSMTKRRSSDNSGVMDEMGMTQEKDNDTYVMNQFDFLFYVPLREMPEGTDDIVDMIKGRLKKYKTLVDDIFTNDSERVLILADGLDELTPSKSRRPQWIPKSSLTGVSTILTTSRPSSRGILKLKSSDFDLKVTLLGLKDNNSVQYMIKKYMKLIDKKSDVTAFNDALSNLPFKDIKNAPMLLQQIIWLYCNAYSKGKVGIGKSRTSVYIHIVNAILGWEYERNEDYPKLQCSSFKHLSLPTSVAYYPRCQENSEMLLLLGKIAHDVYIKGNDSSLVFGRHKLRSLGISATDIDAIVQTGILTEVNCADPTYEKSQLSFIHTSYVEVFAGLYICSRYLSEISDSLSSVSPLTILERLIAVTSETSVTEILRLENVLIMICGLVPRLTEHVCECVYKLTPSDENTNANINRVKHQIQDLTYNCLSEHNSFDQETIVKCKLRHPFGRGLSKIMCFSDLVPTSVETCSLDYLRLPHEQCLSLTSFLSQAVSIRTLKIRDSKCTKDKCEGHYIDLTDHKELKSIKLSRNKISVSGINLTCLQSCRISDCKFSHEQCSLLSSCLSQAVSLRTLEIVLIKCTKSECEGHAIDLTNHTDLQSVELSTSKISISGINDTCLQSCRISLCELSHKQFSFLSSCLSEAVLLRTLEINDIKCTKSECEGHAIDLTNHRDLQSVELSTSKISISGINHTCLQSCRISLCELSHKQYSLLSSCLSQAVLLRTLELDRIKCTKNECEGHAIGLTNHRELQSIKLSRNKISVSRINHTCLQSCRISDCNLSHEQCSWLSSCLSQAVSLRTLEIDDIKCTKDECEGHAINFTNHRDLQSIKLSECKTSVSGINSTVLESCILSNCRLSHEQCTSLSSCLSQATLLGTLRLYKVECIKPECEGHCIDLSIHNRLHDIGISSCDKLSLSEVHRTCLTNHKQLSRLHLSTCNMIFITGINPTCLKRCDIRQSNLSHEQCASLCTFLSQIESLDDISLGDIKCIEDACEGHYIDLTNHKQLHTISLSNCNMISITGINPTCKTFYVIRHCNLSHVQCTSLCTFLSQAESLVQIVLSEIRCIGHACEGHFIDLTNHKQLKILQVSNCNMISITGINPTCKTICFIDHCNLSHEQCTSLCTFLSQAESLINIVLSEIKCIEDACEGHFIDLTNHKRLIPLWVSNCNVISITGINPTCKTFYVISHCNLSHERCTSLCTFLSQAESSINIVLSEIRCIEHACEGHFIDLTNHKQLKTLQVSNCNMISITGINPTCLESCEIKHCNLSHEQCTSLCTFLSKSINLREIELTAVKCTKDKCEGHFIDKSNNKLELTIYNCVNIFKGSSTD